MMNFIKNKKNLFADIGLFYSAAIWGSTFIMVKAAIGDINPVTLVAYRFLLAGIILLIVLVIKGEPVFKHIGKAFFMGVILWLLYIPQTIGLKYTSASNSGFITGLFVAFIPIFLRVIFKTKPSVMEVLAAVVSLGGLWVLTGGMSDINIGDILTVLAAVTYALHVLYTDRYMKSGINPFVFACQQFLVVGTLSLITVWVMDLPANVNSANVVWIVIFLGLFPTLGAFVIQMIAQRIRKPMRVSLIFALEPVFAALFAWTIGGEEFITHRAIGGLLIFLALIISGLPVPDFSSVWRRKRNQM
jgi:drug/metabolite transporter (DMT)-like permease